MVNPFDESPPCECGGELCEHEDFESEFGNEEAHIVLACHCSASCPCTEYRPKDDYYYEELRQEANLARWEADR